METIYAILITLIFAAWVWDLKHRVTILESSESIAGMSDVSSSGSSHASHRAVSHQHPTPAKPHKSAPAAATTPPQRIKRENGVPTWVIQ